MDRPLAGKLDGGTLDTPYRRQEIHHGRITLDARSPAPRRPARLGLLERRRRSERRGRGRPGSDRGRGAAGTGGRHAAGDDTAHRRRRAPRSRPTISPRSPTGRGSRRPRTTSACLIAEAIVKARGERASFFGPGEDNVNVVSDFSYRALGVGDDAETAVAAASPATRALLDGFAAGYNRHVADTPSAELPPECRGQPWVRPDLERGPVRLLPPRRAVRERGPLRLGRDPRGRPARRLAGADRGRTATTGRRTRARPGRTRPIGSRSARSTRPASAPTSSAARPRGGTSSTPASRATPGASAGRCPRAGAARLLANPHFPYTGTRRLYQMH